MYTFFYKYIPIKAFAHIYILPGTVVLALVTPVVVADDVVGKVVPGDVWPAEKVQMDVILAILHTVFKEQGAVGEQIGGYINSLCCSMIGTPFNK